jgi:hypothetical protein
LSGPDRRDEDLVTKSARARQAAVGALALAMAACGPSGESMSGDEWMPDTDIFLVSAREGAAGPVLGAPVNITRRAGYDNQPQFLPDGSGFLYTVYQDEQADTYRYVIAEERSLRVTASTSSEYSPTPMPDGTSFSTVRLESDPGGFARLWQFPMSGRSPRLILRDVTGLGYHTWIDQNTVALAIGEPARLELIDVARGERRVVATGIGRCLQVDPVTGELAYLDKSEPSAWRIRYLDLATGEVTRSVAAREESEDFAIARDGAVIMGEGQRLYRLSRPDAGWDLLADWSGQLPGPITRISISPDGGYLAIVAAAS